MVQWIQIIATPPGDFPEWIRNKWIGCILPIHSGKFAVEIWEEFYPVDIPTAIFIAGKNDAKVARWWGNCPIPWEGVFLFPKEVCRLL